MFLYRKGLLLSAIVAWSAMFADTACVLANGPQTLLEWSYGKAADDGKSKLDEPLETDRPDFTESATTVGKGVCQLETGYTFTSDNSGGVRTANHSFPEALLRVG